MKTKINLNANIFTATAPTQSRRKAKIELVLMLALLLSSALAVQAQEISRMISFTNLATTLRPDSTQSLTVQLQDTDGTVVFAEAQPEVAVDASGQISFFFGGLTGGGLDRPTSPQDNCGHYA